MTALRLHRPSLAADHIEWQLLEEGVAEFSRGDLEPESAWTVTPEDATSEEQEIADASSSTRSAKVDDTLAQIAYRCASLKGAYALELNQGVVRRTASINTDAELVYRFLLACSRPETSQALGDTFTELCKLALTRFFGGRASVWNIDARSSDRAQMGSTTPKVVAFLAPKIGARVKAVPHSQLRAQGDGGCDLVATFDFNDQALGHLTVLAQCAASSNENYWCNKIAEPKRFAHNYELTAEPQFCMFIPYVYRNTDGSWENEANCSRMLLFDRSRILAALELDQQHLPPNLSKLLVATMKSAVAKHAAKASKAKSVASAKSTKRRKLTSAAKRKAKVRTKTKTAPRAKRSLKTPNKSSHIRR